jgi:molybdopterin converting factor small subunit
LARDKEKVLSVKFNREAFEKKEKELGQKAGRAVQSLEEKLSSIDMKALEADMKKRPLLYLAVAFSAGVALGAAIGCARRRD